MVKSVKRSSYWSRKQRPKKPSIISRIKSSLKRSKPVYGTNSKGKKVKLNF